MGAPLPRPKRIARAYLQFLRSPLEFCLWCTREVGPVVDLPMPGMRMVLITDPALIERVLLKDQERFIKDWFTRKLSEVVGNGLLVSEGAFWKRQRRLMQPAFHQQRIPGYAQVMAQETRDTLALWADGAKLDVHAEMMALTLRIVARTLFGSGIAEADAKRVESAISAVMDRYLGVLGSGFVLPLAIPTPGALRFKREISALDTILLDIIERRRRAGGAGGGDGVRAAAGQGADLLDMLLEMQDEDGERMTDRQLRDECMTLFLAGHETTALNLSYCFYLLGTHPEVEAKLHAELDGVLGGRPVEFADLPNLPYMRAIIQEALRLYPPAWSMGREATQDVELGDYTLSAGTQVWIAPYASHRNAEHFPEPERFVPERWLDGLDKRLPRYVFMPFGGGPRICIGNAFALTEAATVLATIAQRHRLELHDAGPLELVPTVTLRPKGGIGVTLHAR